MNALKAFFMALLGLGCADPVDAHQWVDDGALLLDVRTPGEFAGGHIRGSVNVPIDELSGRLAEVEADRVVVYCHSGVRSARAARLLAAEGKEVLDLGGMNRWGKSEDIIQ